MQSLEAQLQLAKATSEQREDALARHRSRALALAGNPGGPRSADQGPLATSAKHVPEVPALTMREDMARRAARMAAVLGGEGSQARPPTTFYQEWNCGPKMHGKLLNRCHTA